MSIVPTDHHFGEAWIAAYFTDVDSLDPSALLRWYAEDASFRFAARPTVLGKRAIARSLAAFFETIYDMQHKMTGAWVDYNAKSAVWESDVAFTRKDGSRVTIPAMSALRIRDGLLYDFRFVMDPAPLYGAVG